MHNDYCATTLREGMVEDFASLVSLLTGTPVHFGICTCCAEPLPAFLFGTIGRDEWAHSTNGHYAEMRHIHVDGTSSDCDGNYSRTNVLRIPSIIAGALVPEYLRSHLWTAPDFSDLWNFVIRHEPPLYGHGDPCTVELTEDCVRWSRRTDEGGESGEAHVCHDPDCAHEARTYRDHRAESMGY